MTGTCRLCLRTGVSLRKSHLLPAALYRSLRGDPNVGNPNPWEISRSRARQTSHQRRAHLLCGDCEQRFSRGGEKWIFRNGLHQDGSFPLASALALQRPIAMDNATAVYHAANIPAVNIPALAYFASSMFWRASIYPWRSDGLIPVNLGTSAESFRLYLMGQGGFPQTTSLLVAVRVPSAMSHLTYEPMGESNGSVYRAKFPMPGFGFSIAIADDLPDVHRRTCFLRGPGNPIMLTTRLEEMLWRDGNSMFKRIQSSRTPQG